MFDFLHIPEINDNYLKSLLFIISIALTFFSTDYWLLTKSPDINRVDIKLVDFFISRLRLMVPLSFCMILVLFYISSNFYTSFFMGAVEMSFSFYASAIFFKHWHKVSKGFHKFPLTFWLFQFTTLSIMASIIDEYPHINRIIGKAVVVVLNALIIPFIYLRIEKVRNAAPKEEN